MKFTNLSVDENIIFRETTKFQADEYKWFYSIFKTNILSKFEEDSLKIVAPRR